jgi:hypothetical protein
MGAPAPTGTLLEDGEGNLNGIWLDWFIRLPYKRGYNPPPSQHVIMHTGEPRDMYEQWQRWFIGLPDALGAPTNHMDAPTQTDIVDKDVNGNKTFNPVWRSWFEQLPH